MLEVEVKASFGEGKLAGFMSLNPEFIRTEFQEDIYFNHPSRDFAETDEALRVRKANGNYFLTYKGKKIDSETKTREEIEISCSKEIIDIFDRLGFKKAAEVKKTRKIFGFDNLNVSIDDVSGLGGFIEIESGNYEDLNKIFEILGKLGIKKEETIRESYLELILKKTRD